MSTRAKKFIPEYLDQTNLKSSFPKFILSGIEPEIWNGISSSSAHNENRWTTEALIIYIYKLENERKKVHRNHIICLSIWLRKG